MDQAQIKTALGDLAKDAQQDDNHNVALAALQELSKRPGVQTTEFYLAAFCGTVGTVLQFVPGREVIGAILLAVSTLAYTLSRGIQKRVPAAAAMFLALALGFAASGCSTQGYVKAEAISDALHGVCARHDAYTDADPKLSDAQKATNRRDTELLLKLIDEATKGTPAAATGDADTTKAK